MQAAPERLGLVLACVLLTPLACTAQQLDTVPGTAALADDWVRVSKDQTGRPLAMQTAIVHYEGVYAPAGRKVAVDLVGAVHVGDANYYATLNERFTRYEALLYELVAPAGTIVPKGSKASTRNPLGALQAGMKSMLGLEHQLEQVDYTQQNFVHADMSPEQFFKSMKDRNEGIVQMYLRMTGQALAVQGASGEGGGDLEILLALFATDRERRLKIAMARQLAQTESLLSAFGGEEGSTLITERNKVAMDVLMRELAVGRTRLGVFYGAGHLPDMDERLRRDFGLKPTGVEWLTAWDLSPEAGQ